MEANTVVGLMGYGFLLASWIVPYIMKKINKDNADRYLVGMILAAISLGFFVSTMVVQWMK
jgi:hypothetical protein